VKINPTPHRSDKPRIEKSISHNCDLFAVRRVEVGRHVSPRWIRRRQQRQRKELTTVTSRSMTLVCRRDAFRRSNCSTINTIDSIYHNSHVGYIDIQDYNVLVLAARAAFVSAQDPQFPVFFQSCHPSLPHSFIPRLKRTFSTNPSYHGLLAILFSFSAFVQYCWN